MEKQKNIFSENDKIGTEHGWRFITAVNKLIEVWKTPTRFLSCYKYGGVFVFSDSENEALEIAKELSKSC